MSEHNNPPREVLGEFIDAVVRDALKARRLLDKYPSLRDARYLHDETVLHFLAVEGYADAVRRLCEWGFDPNAPNKFGDSPLIDVAVLANVEIAKILLEFGADSNATSKTRDNALHVAVEQGDAPMMDLLLSHGARADYVTDLGETLFDVLPNNPNKRLAVDAVIRKYVIKRP